MRVPEALQALDESLAIAGVRAVRVALAVGELMMLAVVRDPADDVALDGELAEDRERVAHSAVGLERPVGEQPVVPHRDPDPREDVSHDQDRELDRPNQPVPEEDDRDDETDRRQDDAGEVGELASAAHADALAPPVSAWAGIPQTIVSGRLLRSVCLRTGRVSGWARRRG